MFHDLRYAVRSFAKNPGYTSIIILTLGLGIGANTAIFSVLNAVLLRPLPYTDPGQLVMIWDRFERMGDGGRTWVHDLQVRRLREQATTFEGFAAVLMVSGRILGGDRPVHTNVGRASAEFFDLLGVQPYLGRTFKPGEDAFGSPWLVLLTHDYWTREFGQDPDVIGKNIVVGFPQMEIIGILPPDFDHRVYQAIGEPVKPDLWIPHWVDWDRLTTPVPGRGVAVLGRMKPGVTIEDARAELAHLAETEDGEYFNNAGFSYEVVPLINDIVADVKPALLVLVGAVGFVLLIATANITTLILGRTQHRQVELMLRHSLGASRFRVARQLLTENLLLAIAGGGLGLWIAYMGSDVLVALAPMELPRMDTVGVDLRVLGFTGLAALATGMLSGLVPIWHMRRTDLAGVLREGGRGATDSRHSRRTRNAMVILEFAMSVVLLVGAGLMVRSFIRLQRVDPGFEPEGRLTFSVYLMQEYSSDVDKRNAFFDQLAERLRGLPGVQGVGATSALPLHAPSFGPVFKEQNTDTLRYTLISGFGLQADPERFASQQWLLTDMSAVQPGYFRTAGIAMVSGREFTAADDDAGVPLVVIDEKLAQAFWPGEDAVGKNLWTFNTWVTVIGVARHAHHHAYGDDGPPQLYAPYARTSSGRVSMVVRTSGDPYALVEPIREEVKAIDPLVPIADIRTMEDIVGEAVAQRRFTMTLMTVFAAAAILLAALGIYGVLSFTVGQRTKEIAVRMAMGSTGHTVARLVVGEGMTLAVVGSIIGVGVALGLGRVVESMLFQVEARDPVSFATATVVIAVVAFVACWIPARRATAVDPASILREG